MVQDPVAEGFPFADLVAQPGAKKILVRQVVQFRTPHNRTRLTMSAKFLGSASNSGRGILPRRGGWKPLPLFHWIPTEHFKAGIET